ncbi:hypothetical protein [Streptomyces sp. NPDC057616]|uniref:hypothetical protein n=1 Tax=Streptomyces sp. NPDC057616 TaxID=3346183 RepID=UPI00367E22A4
MAHLSACDAFVNAVDECVLALGTAEATNDFSLYDGALECVDLAVYRTVEIRDSDVDHQLGKILMLGPAEVSDSAISLRSNVRAVQQDVAHLTNALIPSGPEPPDLGPLDDWWSKVERAKDRLLENRAAFVAHAQTTLTNPRVSG